MVKHSLEVCTLDYQVPLTLCIIVLLERLIITQSKNSQSLMEPKGSLMCSLGSTTGSYLEPDYSSHCPPMLFLQDLYCFYHCINNLFPSGFAIQNFVCISHLPMCAACPAHLILELITQIFCEEHIMKILIKQFSPLSYYYFSLRFKYSEHPILKFPESLFFPWGELKFYTHIKRQMIMVLCILISRFLDRQENKRVNSMVASIPRILSDPSVFVNAFWICYCHALS